MKYSDAYEALESTTTTYISKFYTEETKNYLKPFIELNWDTDQVTDQRDEIAAGLTRRLYLYTRRFSSFASVNDISGVTITYGHPSYDDTVFAASAITEQYPGVYYIEFTGPEAFNPGETNAKKHQAIFSFLVGAGQTYLNRRKLNEEFNQKVSLSGTGFFAQESPKSGPNTQQESLDIKLDVKK